MSVCCSENPKSHVNIVMKTKMSNRILYILISSLLTFVHSVVINDLKIYCNIGELTCECSDINFGNEAIEFAIPSVPNTCIAIIFKHSNLPTIPLNVFNILKSTQIFHIKSCNLQSIAKENFRDGNELSLLDLGGNEIETLPSEVFSYLYKLEQLHLNKNNIRILEANSFYNLTQLRLLDLSNNKIKSVNLNDIRHLENLKSLILSNNKIDFIPNDLFSSTKRLEILSLKDNYIQIIDRNIVRDPRALKFLQTKITQKTKFTDPDFLNELTNVLHLNLAGNYFGYISDTAFSNMENLLVLNLKHNNVTSIETRTFSYNKKLSLLNLADNQLRDFDSLSLPNLQFLYIGNNELTELDNNNLPKTPRLKKVDLTRNPWNCDYLTELLNQLIDKNINIQKESTINDTATNVAGIACSNDDSFYECSKVSPTRVCYILTYENF